MPDRHPSPTDHQNGASERAEGASKDTDGGTLSYRAAKQIATKQGVSMKQIRINMSRGRDSDDRGA